MMLVVIALILVVVCIAFVTHFHVVAIILGLVPAIIVAITLIPLLRHFMDIPIDIEVDFKNRKVITKTRRGTKEYTYNSIECVRTGRYLSVRVFGLGFPGIAVGLFTSIDGSTVYAYTDTKLSLLVETVDGKKYLFWLPENLRYLCRGVE
ncbi:MAG: PH domain-containing protein [Ignisphaera sp.]